MNFLKMDGKEQYAAQFIEIPLMNSYDKTPERQISTLSEPVSLIHSLSSSDGSPSFKTSKQSPLSLSLSPSTITS